MTSRPLHLHLVAIGGTGMAPLACLLQAQGHIVTGSDAPLYPPMSQLLEAAGIRPLVGYSAEHLQPPPDVVIIGNAVRRDNPEAVETERLGLPRLSMPEALARFFLADRQPLVVAGTHGKTTTSAMAATVWSECGRDPGFLIGGVPIDLGVSFRRGSGPRFVIEGDEYNAAYFDRGAKFLHYRPETLILTSVEYDHADLYSTPETLLAAYARLIALVPESGLIVACGDSAEIRQLAAAARAPVVFYGERDTNAVRLLGAPAADSAGVRFRLREETGDEHAVAMPVWGVHNVVNALAVWAAGVAVGSRRASSPARCRDSAASSVARSCSRTMAASWWSTTSRTIRRRWRRPWTACGCVSRVAGCSPASNPAASRPAAPSCSQAMPAPSPSPTALSSRRSFIATGWLPRIDSISRRWRKTCPAPGRLVWWRRTSRRCSPGCSTKRSLETSS